jgi:hypothetical protein
LSTVQRRSASARAAVWVEPVDGGQNFQQPPVDALVAHTPIIPQQGTVHAFAIAHCHVAGHWGSLTQSWSSIKQ